MKDELKDYLSSGREWLWMVTIVAAAIFLIQGVGILKGNGDNWFGFIFFVSVFLLSRLPDFLFASFLKKIKAEGIYELAKKDFESAVSLVEDRVRLGKNYIFSKGKSRLLKYEDIVQVYQYVHKTNFIENERALMYVDINGSTRKLCNLKLRGASDGDAMKMIGIIVQNNPNVKVGYR